MKKRASHGVDVTQTKMREKPNPNDLVRARPLVVAPELLGF